MLYEYKLTVAAGKTQASPATTRMKLTKGVIHRVEIQFPIGTRALVHVQIFRGANQVWPDNPDGDIASDGYLVAWDEHYEINTDPTTFTAQGWSTADTYSYDIKVRIGLLSKATVSPLAGLVGSLGRVLKFLGAGA